MTTVLITGMGSTTAISVVKGLRRDPRVPVRIVGTDINHREEIAGSSFCDQFYTVPQANDKNYIPELLRICETEGVEVLFPIIDPELEVISMQLKAFQAKGVYVWISDPGTVRTCNDKYLTYLFFVEHNFPTPKTWLGSDLEGREENLSYPLIVKPARGVSSIDVFRVKNAAELRNATDKVEAPVVQEYVEGTEYTIDVVSDMTCKLLAVVPRERVEVKAGISYKGRTVRDEQLIEQTGEIARALGIRGACNIQCRVRDGRPIFFEVNPRFSGTLPLTIAAGVNSPLLLMKLAIGEKLDQIYYNFREGVYMARYWEEIFYYG